MLVGLALRFITGCSLAVDEWIAAQEAAIGGAIRPANLALRARAGKEDGN